MVSSTIQQWLNPEPIYMFIISLKRFYIMLDRVNPSNMQTFYIYLSFNPLFVLIVWGLDSYSFWWSLIGCVWVNFPEQLCIRLEDLGRGELSTFVYIQGNHSLHRSFFRLWTATWINILKQYYYLLFKDIWYNVLCNTICIRHTVGNVSACEVTVQHVKPRQGVQ